jgi:hypothetical protein|tara:strand:- start:210 stop:419 length:210 start_codon:yes stop_codon:yes gene_type:complete
MATQTSFVERTPEQKSAWVEQQRALGNKNILSKREWYKKNETRIRLENMETKQNTMDKKMDLILSKLPK